MGNRQDLIDYNPDDYSDDLKLDLNPMSYPNFGNYHLRRMDLKELIELSIEEQADFSDAITRRYATNKLFHEKMLEREPPITSEQFIDSNIKINETGVGNLAFMAFHNPNSVFSKQYEDMKKLIREN